MIVIEIGGHKVNTVVFQAPDVKVMNPLNFFCTSFTKCNDLRPEPEDDGGQRMIGQVFRKVLGKF